MNFFKKCIHAYIRTHIHVALSVVSFIAITGIHYSISISKALYASVFFATCFGYNYIEKLTKKSPWVALNSTKGRFDFVFETICLLGILFFSRQFLAKSYMLLGLLVLVSILYVVPVFKRENLRNATGFKVFCVAFVWTGITVVFPLLEAEYNYNGIQLFGYVLHRFICVFVLMIPFEIRDIAVDKKSNLHTIAIRFGSIRTKQLGYFLTLLMLILFSSLNFNNNTWFLSGFSLTVLLLAAVYYTKEKQTSLYASFVVEALPIVWFLTTYLLESSF